MTKFLSYEIADNTQVCHTSHWQQAYADSSVCEAAFTAKASTSCHQTWLVSDIPLAGFVGL